MSRLHLIERAARRLGGTSPLFVPEPAVTEPEPAHAEIAAESLNGHAPHDDAPDHTDGHAPQVASDGLSATLLEERPAAAGLADVAGLIAEGDAAVAEAPRDTARRTEAPPVSRPLPPSLADRAASAASVTQPAHRPGTPERPRLDGPAPGEGRPPIDFATLEHAGMVVGRKARTRISEEFRVSVANVLRAMRSARPGQGAANMLMVTSSRPGEGKSFTAVNLAVSMAQHGVREVLLVDMDAKDQSVTYLLGLSNQPGLLDLAADVAMRPEDVIVRTVVPNLSVVPVGAHRTETSHAFAVRPINSVIERLARRFPNHILLLDAPPCLSTSDPSTVAALVGQIVMVVEAERTQKGEVEASLELIKACPNITIMLNKIRMTTNATFGAYHYFGSYS